jgi:tRNA-2-methylthio-N6-dimethylallyladenosine synthase
MAGKVEKSELEDRNQELLQILAKQSLKSNVSFVGSKVEVLVEGMARKGGGQLMGRTLCYRKINFEGDASLIGKIRMIKVTEATSSSLMGTLSQ